MTHPSSSGTAAHARSRLSLVPPRPELGADRSGPAPAVVGSSEVARFAREVWESAEPMERMQRGVGLVVELVDGCDHAGVSLRSRGRLEPGPATDAVAGEADRLQHDLDEGPSLDAVRASGSVMSWDLTSEPRWRRWGPLAVERLGTRAAMSLVLFDDARVFGSLNLYSDRAAEWSSPARGLAHALATHVALALADAVQMEHRGRAMVSRTVIGQAQGILMERFTLTADSAYAVLLRTSQQNHRKIAAVAADLVRTGRLPHPADDVTRAPATH